MVGGDLSPVLHARVEEVLDERQRALKGVGAFVFGEVVLRAQTVNAAGRAAAQRGGTLSGSRAIFSRNRSVLFKNSMLRSRRQLATDATGGKGCAHVGLGEHLVVDH